MMRALWTAATGMTGQQTNVDVIANNLSNVNTVAYKKSTVMFKDLVYDNKERAYNLDDKNTPVDLQVGLGAKPAATLRDFRDGNYQATENPTDLAISGEGFFTLKNAQDEIIYTRDGSFKFSPTEEGQMLVNSQGYQVLDAEGNSIILTLNSFEDLSIGQDGELSIRNEDNEIVSTGIELGIVRFPNSAGLLNLGANNYASTENSGAPIWENAEDNEGKRSTVLQYHLESSNVQLVDEMVNLIVAQRAYEINSKAINAADEMLQQANNLKR